MVIPSAMFIEMGQDLVKTTLPLILTDQRKELHAALGDGATEDLAKGYELGLATARSMLAMSAALAVGKVDPDDVL